MTIPPDLPAQTEREYMICANSFQWPGNAKGLADKWGLSIPELRRILKGPYGPGSWNG